LRPSSRRASTKSEENKTSAEKPEPASQAKTDDQIDGTRQAAESRAEDPEVVEQGGEGGDHSGEGGEDDDGENFNLTPPWEVNPEEV
jgi:hypothetical protein